LKKSSLLSDIIALWRYLGNKRRWQFLALFALTMLSVFTEIVSIGAVVPFLSALTAPENLMQLTWFQPILDLLHIQSSEQLLFPLTIGFALAAVFSAVIRIVLLWANARLSASMGVQLRCDVYARALYQPYVFHIAHNSSEVISLVSEKVSVAVGAGILHVLMLFTSLMTSFAIMGTLLWVNTLVAMTAFFVLGGGYVLVGYLTRKQINNNGDIIAKNQPEAVKYIQEGLGGIRDIIIDSSQQVFINSYTKVAKNIQMAGMKNSILSTFPKSILEMIGIVLIAALAYYLQIHTSEKESALPILGALALGSQRLLPALQQVYFSWSTINGSKAILSDVLSSLKQPIPSTVQQDTFAPLPFTKNIMLHNVGFHYTNTETNVLETIDLNIAKGSRIGFIGSTGSGKSTLLDIVMGLLPPSQGHLEVDGVPIDTGNLHNWQANIAHVPQSIFLSDASMSENIAFGVPKDKIDMHRVKISAKKAHIAKFIEELPHGYETSVGERGIQLSGGQRQRIGIARALYKNASLIVFDEATSALDDVTEHSVMKAIDALDENLTILIIAHRLSTLEGCDVIYRLENGFLVESVLYDEMRDN